MTRTPEQQARIDHVNTLAMTLMTHLSGEGRSVQGAVLADLVSLWLIGHHHPSRDDGKTTEVRQRVLQGFLEVVLRLGPINERMVAEGKRGLFREN